MFMDNDMCMCYVHMHISIYELCVHILKRRYNTDPVFQIGGPTLRHIPIFASL